MSIELMFPSPGLTKTEQDLLVEIYKTPVVQKHLKIIALNDAKELLALSGANLSADEIALAHEHVRGKLAVVSTLLSFIQEVQSIQSNKE